MGTSVSRAQMRDNHAKLLAIAYSASVRSQYDANPPLMTAGLHHMQVLKHVPVLYFVLTYEDTDNSSLRRTDLMWSFALVRPIDVKPLRHYNQGLPTMQCH